MWGLPLASLQWLWLMVMQVVSLPGTGLSAGYSAGSWGFSTSATVVATCIQLTIQGSLWASAVVVLATGIKYVMFSGKRSRHLSRAA